VSENCRHLFSSKFIKDSLGTIGYGNKSELLLEVVATGHSSNVIGSYWAENCSNVMYSFDLRNCNNCFLCSGLRGKSYYYKNKKVDKEKYLEILKSYNLHTYSGQEKAKQEFASPNGKKYEALSMDILKARSVNRAINNIYANAIAGFKISIIFYVKNISSDNP
jgi:hypothetical protein